MQARTWERARLARRVATATLLWGGIASGVHAQSLYDRSENIAVASRPHPEYDALGVRVGTFTMYPRISITGTYDDNVYGLPNKTSGFIVSAAPSADFVSNWSRHSLEFNLRYERDEYVDQSSESSNEYSLSSNGRLDIDHASAATFRFDVAELTEARTAPDSFVGSREPVRYDVVTTGSSIYREFNRLRLDGEVSNSFYSFFNTPLLNGALFDESSRDENSTYERLRASYAVDPNFALFVQVTPNQSHFLHAPLDGFTNFDSSGYSVEGGINGQVTHLITADVGLGFFSQDYKDSRIPNISGFAYNANVHYFPTQLLTVTARASPQYFAFSDPGDARVGPRFGGCSCRL